MTFRRIDVMHQLFGPRELDSCSYHALKNVLVRALFLQKSISQQTFHALLRDKFFFKLIFNNIVMRHPNGDVDATIPTLLAVFERIRQGKIDLRRFGITNDMLQTLSILPSTNSAIRFIHYHQYRETPEPGLSGFAHDFLNAASLAKLARTNGAVHQVFAVGLNNSHWLSLSLTQNTEDARTWSVMDSDHTTDPLLYEAAIARLESVLRKNKTQLKVYLNKAYEASAYPFMRAYDRYFSLNAIIAGQEDAAKAFFINNLQNKEDYLQFIKDQLAAMEAAGWLQAPDNLEHVRIEALHTLTSFMLKKSARTDEQTHNLLAPICATLKTSLALAINEDPVDIEAQQSASMDALNNQSPNFMGDFITSFVHGIKAIWHAIINGLSNAYNCLTGNA